MPGRVVQVKLGHIVIAFVAVTVAFVVQGVLLVRLIDRADTSRDALCAQRQDLDQRITVQENLLNTHRGQKFIFKIPRSLIEAGLARDRVTRHNLEILDCKELP